MMKYLEVTGMRKATSRKVGTSRIFIRVTIKY